MEENTSKIHVGTADVMTPGAGSGSALFVINLCASIAPVQTVGKNLPGLDNYRLYQVVRVEDGRTRHRLRLGFFTSEAHAASVLTVVRQQYPTAFTTSLCDEDRRFVRGYLPESAAAAPSPAPARPTLAPAPVQPAPSVPAAVKAAPKPAAPSVPQHAAPAPAPAPAASSSSTPASRTLSRAEPEVIELSWEPKSAPATNPPVAAANATPAKKPAAPSSTATTSSPMLALSLADPPPPSVETRTPISDAPFHVGKGVAIADSGLSLHDTQSTRSLAPANQKPAAVKVTPAPAAKPAPGAPAKAAASVTKVAALPPAAARSSGPARPSLQGTDIVLPELDTTQTIRALTSAELNDDTQEKFFAIELAASEQPVNLDTMPRLDIFEAYRLYSVAIAGSGRITHSLRLGFFKEEVSAEAVSGYLNTFFGSPKVLRVSVAEHARFKEAPQPKVMQETKLRAEAKVVELTNVRAGRPVPTVTQEVSLANTTATGSFRTSATGSQKKLIPKLKPAAKSAGAATKSGPATRDARNKSGTTGKHQALQPRKSLSEQLLDEAREVELSESGIRKLPKNDSLLSRLVDKLTK